MADPLSLAASIAAVITFTAQAGKLIDDFVSSYRDTNSELEEVGTEIRLLEVVLGELEKAYRSRIASTGPEMSDGHGENGKSAPTDTTLKTVIDGLNQCMKRLKDVIIKSCERMERGGLHKIKVQTVWQQTSKRIDKIRMSLFGYKMTLMLLLEAKTYETTKPSEVTEAAVQAALKKAEPYRYGIVVGEKTLIEVRQYLDDIEDIPSEPSDVQIGAMDTVQTFRGFDEWIASFSASPSQQEEDDRLVDALRTRDKSTKEDERCASPLASENPGVTCAPQSKVLLIVTDLRRPTSKEVFVEQLFVNANIEIKEVLQILKDKGYSSVTGFQTRGPNKEGTIGPVYPMSGPVPVVVTTGRSCYDVSKGLRINQDETFVSFYNRYIMQRRRPRSELSITRKFDSIHIKDSLMDEGCTVSFRRTLRVPDDMNAQNTPSTFGPFPLINISRCETARVPPQIKEKCGLLIPLLQREALCVAFDSNGYRPERRETKCLFSARLFAGSVNAVSGMPSAGWPVELQDYIVMPLQDRVDGFNDTDGGHVKQFVAAPLGSGYSVESQLAENEIGGLQLQIAPRLKTCVRFESIGAVDGNGWSKLPLMRSPRDVGLANGQVIRMTEENDFSLIAPWNWRPADRPSMDLKNWALWTWPECVRSTGSGGSCWRCLGGPRYWKTIRPAYLSDLLNDAGIEQQGALAVSALSPISVTLRHFAEGRVDAPERMLFSTRLQVSPFESVPVLECRILHLLELRWEEYSMTPPMVTFRGSNWPGYKARRGEHYTSHISIQTLGITEGSIIETVESLQIAHAAPPQLPEALQRRPVGKPVGWEMALAGGGTIRQGIKVDPIPSHWNWDAAHFINIQILNTVAFESVTGLAPPPSPISFAEYSEAGIPSMSFYPDKQTYSSVRGKFPVLRSVGEMDAVLGVTYAVRLSADGNPIACVVCERRICDAVLEPCHHAFCTTCIRLRMRRAGHITCLLCSKPSTKTIISSAPMDITYLPTSVSQKQHTQDLCCSPSRASEPTHMDSLPSLCALERIMGMTLRLNDKETKEAYVRSILKPGGKEGESDLKCRLALAQLLKDIDYPRQPPKDFIVAAVNASLGDFIQNYSHDILEILLGISVCSEDQSALGESMLRRACSYRTEEFAKRLVDEGYDWHVLKKKFRKDEKREWSSSEEVRKRILAYVHEERVLVKKTALEFEGAESITSQTQETGADNSGDGC